MSKVGIQLRGTGAVRSNLRGGGIAKRGTGQALKSGGRTGKFGGGRTNLLEQLGRVEAERSNPNRRAEISRVHGELNRGYAKGGRTLGRAGRRKDFKTHGRDVPTMAAKGGRIGLKHGGKPWGTGPKPGTHEFLMQNLHKKRKGKAIGGAMARHVLKGAKKVMDRITHEVPTGPHTDVRRRELNKKWKRKKLGVSPEMKATLKGLRGKSLRNPHTRDVPTMAAEGGRIGLKKGEKVSEKSTHSRIPGYKPHPHGTHSPGNIKALRKAWGRTQDKKPHSTAEGRHATSSRKFGRVLKEAAGMKKGGKADKNWIQKATASIKKRGTKGKCTPITKPGCTGRAKALAKTFKKMAAKRKS